MGLVVVVESQNLQNLPQTHSNIKTQLKHRQPTINQFTAQRFCDLHTKGLLTKLE